MAGPPLPVPNPAVPTTSAALYGLAKSFAGYEPTPGYIAALKKTPAEALRGKAAVEGTERDLLGLLGGQHHGPALLVVLVDRLRWGQTDAGTLMTAIMAFCQTVLPSTLQCLPDYTASLAERVHVLAGQLGSFSLALSPLHNLLARYMPVGTLTPVYGELLKASLKAREYGSALDIMRHDVYDIDMRLAPVNYQDNLVYHYLGGIIQALNGQYQRAMQFLDVAVSAPGPGISAIQTEAYKKLVLISLLHSGRLPTLPKCTSNHLRSTYKAVSADHAGAPYGEFAAAYAGATVKNEGGQKCYAIAEKQKDSFEKDRNSGLVQMCLRALQDRTILALTKTYSTVRLSAIASALDLTEPTSSASLSTAASLVSGLVSRRLLFAAITPLPPPSGDAVVRFTEDPEPYVSESTASQLDSMSRGEKDWRRYLVHLTREVEVNAEFLKRVVKEAKEGAGPGGAYGGGLYGMGGGAAPFEEMMEVEGMNGWEDEFGS